MGIESDGHWGYDLDFDPWPFADRSVLIETPMFRLAEAHHAPHGAGCRDGAKRSAKKRKSKRTGRSMACQNRHVDIPKWFSLWCLRRAPHKKTKNMQWKGVVQKSVWKVLDLMGHVDCELELGASSKVIAGHISPE